MKRSIAEACEEGKRSEEWPPLPESPVVARYDKLEFLIDAVPTNSAIFNNHFPEVLDCLNFGVDGPCGADFRVRQSVRPGMGNWRLVVENAGTPFNKVTVTGPLKHLGNDLKFERSVKGSGTIYDACGHGREAPFEPPEQIRGRLMPTERELLELGQTIRWRPDYFGKLTITNRRKLFYQEYMELLFDTISGLEALGIQLTPREVETCFDTVDPSVGVQLLSHAMPARFIPDDFYHFADCPYRQNEKFNNCPTYVQDSRKPCKKLRGNKCRIPCKAPSQDGLDEYCGYRKSGWIVLHPYVHEVKVQKKVGRLFRVEAQLYRRFLRGYMRDYRISSCTELLHSLLPYAVFSCFRFAALDLPRLRWKSRTTETRGFRRMSTRGQSFLLRQRGLSANEVSRFTKPAPVPNVIVPVPTRGPYGHYTIAAASVDLQNKTFTPLSDDEVADTSTALWI